jgi:hypothetical protein
MHASQPAPVEMQQKYVCRFPIATPMTDWHLESRLWDLELDQGRRL